jgi:DNA recombination protein RmuC
VVDAKVPLAAYLEAIEADDEGVAKQKLREHSRQLRSHMRKLSGKNYWQQFDFTPEFVVVFLPGEVFYSAALQHDPGLIEAGVADNIIIATPMILIALLKAIAYGWRQDAIARNATEINKLGKELYKRLAIMGGHFTQLRKNIEGTVDSFNKTAGALESRVLPGARRFRDIGTVPDGDEIPAVAAIDKAPTALRAVELFGGIDAYRAAQAVGNGSPSEINGVESG